MRSPEYVKVVTSVYREAIDAYFKGKFTAALKHLLRQRLTPVFARGSEAGFYLGSPGDAGSKKGSHGYDKIFLGEVTNFYQRISVAEVKLTGSGVSVGDEILIFGKTTAAVFFRVSELQVKHQSVKNALKGELVGIKLSSPVKPKDKVFIWRKKD
jgi:putative protease